MALKNMKNAASCISCTVFQTGGSAAKLFRGVAHSWRFPDVSKEIDVHKKSETSRCHIIRETAHPLLSDSISWLRYLFFIFLFLKLLCRLTAKRVMSFKYLSLAFGWNISLFQIRAVVKNKGVRKITKRINWTERIEHVEVTHMSTFARINT